MTEAMNGFAIFFRATSYCTDSLRHAWCRFVLSEPLVFKVADRLVLLGDHTLVVKDGERMPGVASLRETSAEIPASPTTPTSKPTPTSPVTTKPP